MNDDEQDRQYNTPSSVTAGQTPTQTPNTGLRHPSSNHLPVHYAIGLEKLSANEQFFDDAQTVVSL